MRFNVSDNFCLICCHQPVTHGAHGIGHIGEVKAAVAG